MNKTATGGTIPPENNPSKFSSVSGSHLATLPSQPPKIPDHELLRPIGTGSYGEVWLARSALGTVRAVKVISRASFDHDHPFEREFKGIQKFEPVSRSHEGLVDILQVGRNHAAGCFYYVMELADDAGSGSGNDPKASITRTGHIDPATYSPKTLRSLLRPPAHFPTFPSARSRLPVARCIQIGLSLADALAHLHKGGLVHRDIKPSNIIFVGGAPKLADIGLVADISEARSFVGTTGFIPPEGPGTAQADLYSLGKVLYEISTGHDRQDFPALPPDLRDLPDADALIEFNEIVVKACDHDARRRYATAEELHADLLHLQRGQSVIQKHAHQRHLALAAIATLAISAIALVVAGIWLHVTRFNASTVQRSNASAPVEVNSIAVLPLVNQSTWMAHEYLSDALTDETMNALTNCAGLRVAPRPAVFAFKRATNDLRQIGQRLGVRTVLTGSMNRKDSTNLHLTARLINVADGAELCSTARDGPSTNMGTLQRQLAQDVAQALGFELSDAAGNMLESNLVRKLEAYRLHRAALKHVNPATKRDFTEVVNLYNQALALDPQYATAYVGLGDAYIMASDAHMPPKSAMPTARSYLLRALEIDDSLAVAHSFLAITKIRYDHDWVGARQELQRALELDRSASLWAWLIYLWSVGPLEEAEAVAREDLQREPERPFRVYNLGFVHLLQRRYDEALEKARWLVQHDANSLNGYWLDLEVQIWKGKYAEAMALANKILAIDEEPSCLSAQGYIYARMGRREEAAKIIAALERLAPTRFVSKGCWALIYNGLGDKQRALDYLEQADEERSEASIYLHWAPLWDSYRAEPRFITLLKKVGLEK